MWNATTYVLRSSKPYLYMPEVDLSNRSLFLFSGVFILLLMTVFLLTAIFSHFASQCFEMKDERLLRSCRITVKILSYYQILFAVPRFSRFGGGPIVRNPIACPKCRDAILSRQERECDAFEKVHVSPMLHFVPFKEAKLFYSVHGFIFSYRLKVTWFPYAVEVSC